MFSKFLTISVMTSLMAISTLAAGAFAGEQAVGPAYSPETVSVLKATLSRELAQAFRQFNNPRIELGMIRLLGGKLPTQVKSVSLISENARGEAQFNVYGEESEAAQVLVDYAAWIQIRVANRRIMPGERLSNEEFNDQEVNVATGMPYELRGVLLSKTEDVTRLQSRQSVLEGQFLVANAVEKIPDVRRGDPVRIRVISGDLNLSTMGTASEPGYTSSTIKVMTVTSHRELTGTLLPGGLVEVKL